MTVNRESFEVRLREGGHTAPKFRVAVPMRIAIDLDSQKAEELMMIRIAFRSTL